MKKSERQAKEALRQVTGRRGDLDNVVVVTKRGARMQYNEGQAIKQAPGSGIKDIVSFLKPKKR